MVHMLLGVQRLAELEARGLITATFRRLDADRQSSVMNAILAEARQRGPSRVRLKETAQAAGVSVGSLYQYFTDREGVLTFAVELVATTLVEELSSYVPQLADLPLADGLNAWAAGGFDWSQEQAAVMQFFARGAYEGDAALAERLVHPVAEVMLSAIRAMLTAAVERGEARADLDVDAVARAVHVMLSGVMDAQLVPGLGHYFQVSGGETSAADTLQAAVALVVAGVRP